MGRLPLTTLVDDRGVRSWRPNTRQAGLELAAQGKEGSRQWLIFHARPR